MMNPGLALCFAGMFGSCCHVEGCGHCCAAHRNDGLAGIPAFDGPWDRNGVASAASLRRTKAID